MRSKLVLVSLALLAGCPDRTVSEVPTSTGSVENRDFPANPRRKLDLLFLIDNSGSMADEQASLKANFASFMSVLEQVQGGLPDVHIGVATSDLGTSNLDGTTAGTKFGCKSNGDAGVLHPLVNGQRFISDIADASGGRIRNYSGALADAFTEIADVGTLGCGIEQHLGSMAAALDPANTANTGFVRDDAILAIVIIADEDDCSLAHAGLFESATDGTAVNFQCTEDGVACDTPSTDFLSATGDRADCHPNAHAKWTMDPGHYIEAIRQLKPDPRDLVVAGIVGPSDRFGITKANNATVLGSSCPAGSQFKAFPAVRTATFLQGFPGFTQESICDHDLSPALTKISLAIANSIGSRCFLHAPADLDPTTAGPQYDCSVVEVRERANQPVEELAVLPPCDRNPTGTMCWQIVSDPADCGTTATPSHLALDIQWNGVPHDDTIAIQAQCVTVDDGGSGFQ